MKLNDFSIQLVKYCVKEHKSQIKTCPHCGKLNKAVFPEKGNYSAWEKQYRQPTCLRLNRQNSGNSFS